MAKGERHPRVCLGMPSHGTVTAGAGRGLWRASRSQCGVENARPLRVAVQSLQGSLLAQQFNALWCWALNADYHGERVDYFAMLHSDVEPEDFWLDALIEELEARNLDMLGVAVPIKDQQGMTSLALDRQDGDTWRPLCRLSMREVHQLPETFTSEDVGHPLLLNTGCWVARFSGEWARQVSFTINDRIVFNSALQCYQAQVEPEDWYFSRLCHELGLRIGATRKIAVNHVGPKAFSNAIPFGEEFDSRYVEASAVEGKERQGWRFPSDVDGWMTPTEGRALAELASGKHVLEIGSYCGLSTICMAQTAERVVAYDVWTGAGTPKPRDTRAEFRGNVARYGVASRVEDVDVVQPGDTFDLVFIDGAHDADSVRADIATACDVLADDGMIAFHDYRTEPGEHDGRWDAGVTEAVSEFVSRGASIVSRHGTIAVVRPPVMAGVR